MCVKVELCLKIPCEQKLLLEVMLLPYLLYGFIRSKENPVLCNIPTLNDCISAMYVQFCSEV